MTETEALLRDYVARGSEEAFARLVEGHVDLVYSTALRVVGGDAQLARDVTQVVFADLARKARSLPPRVVLGGWLHRHTFFRAAQQVRAERRRQAREREAVMMHALDADTDSAWKELAPFLDEAITQLAAQDRDAVLLRFFQHRSMRETGEALGISEEAARKRVHRAVDALRTQLVRRGITLSATVLLAAISAHSISAAPTGLAATVATTTFAGAGSAAGGTVSSLLELLAAAKVHATLVGLLFLAGAATPVLVSSASSRPGLPAGQKLAASAAVRQTNTHRGLQTPEGQFQTDTALARLEAWLREAQRDSDSWGIDMERLRFLIWSLPAGDYPRAWKLRESLSSKFLKVHFEDALLQDWADLDGPAALAAATSVKQGWRARDPATAVLKAWARREPAAALGWIEASLPEKFRVATLQKVLPEMARTAPGMALDALAQIPSSGRRAATLTDIMEQWAGVDPAAVASYLSRVPSPELSPDIAKSIAMAWARIDTDAALAWTRGLNSEGQREAALRGTLSTLSDNGPVQAAALLNSLPATNTSLVPEFIPTIAESWAQNDLAAAVDWVQQLPDGELRAKALKPLLEQWSRKEPRAAAEFAAGLPMGDGRQDGVRGVLTKWYGMNAQAALDWANGLPAGPAQDAALRGVCDGMGERNPAQTAAFIASLPPGEVQSQAAVDLVNDWAAKDPQAAANWVALFPEGNTRGEAAARLIDSWVSQSPEAAAGWLEQLPMGPSRDRAAQEFVMRAAGRRPDLAAPLVDVIAEEDQRASLIRRIASSWSAKNPENARQWLRSMGLPEDPAQPLPGE